MRLLLLLLFLIGSSPAWAMEHYSQQLQNQNGKAINGALVTVYLAGTSTPATIYSDNGVTVKANPFTTALDGVVDFYAANGRYDLVFSRSGYVFNAAQTAGIALFDLVDYLASLGAASSFTGITSGANISATMTCGTGCTVTYAGAGIVNARQFKGNLTVAAVDGGTGLTAALDDNTIIGNGTIWESKTLPSCSNASTSKLLYDQATNTFSCGTDQNTGGTPTTVGPNVTTVNAGNSPYTVITTDMSLRCDTTAAARTINLPAATNKLLLFVKNLGANACTIARNGTDTIDGSTSLVLQATNVGVALVSNGVNGWDIQ